MLLQTMGQSDFSHSQTVNLVPTDPKEFLTTILSCEKTMLDYLGITLEIHIEDVSPQILLDRIKMRQAIFNLIRNSCEAINKRQWMWNDRNSDSQHLSALCYL